MKIRLAVMFDILKRFQRVSATLDAVCVSVWRILSRSIPAIVSYYNAYITEIIGGNEGKARQGMKGMRGASQTYQVGVLHGQILHVVLTAAPLRRCTLSRHLCCGVNVSLGSEREHGGCRD